MIEFKSVVICKGRLSGIISVPDVLPWKMLGGAFSLSVD